MPEDLVTIATFLNIGEAKLAQGKLSSAGIEASVRDEHAMNLHIGMAMWGIKLQVPDNQVVRALEVLDDFRAEPVEEESRRRGSALLPGVRVAGNPPRRRRQSGADFAVVGGHPASPSPRRRRGSAGAAWPAGISGKRSRSRPFGVGRYRPSATFL